MQTKARVAYFVLAVITLAGNSFGQSAAPGVGRGAVPPKQEAALLSDMVQPQTTHSSPSIAGTPCVAYTFRWYLPLNAQCKDLGTTKASDIEKAMVQGFFGTHGPVTPVTQVKYLYGFGQGPSTISADLISDSWTPLGSQISFGSTLSSQGNQSNPSATAGTSGASTSQEAAAQLENGGDFFVHAMWPLLYKGGQPVAASDDSTQPTPSSKYAFLMFDPRIGFNFNGFGSQNTITESEENNINLSIETYGQAGSDSGTFVGYLDVRSGGEFIPQASYAQALGLTHRSFLLTSATIGVQITGVIRIGYQYFIGPSQAFGAQGASDFSKPHFVLQFAPHQ
jgi:hypothetical protein